VNEAFPTSIDFFKKIVEEEGLEKLFK